MLGKQSDGFGKAIDPKIATCTASMTSEQLIASLLK
jgi:hypothetical protein